MEIDFHVFYLKENYGRVNILLEALKYKKLQLIGVFNVVGFLIKLQGGYTKYLSNICLGDSRADVQLLSSFFI